MFTIDPKNTDTATFHKYLLGSVVPRPIAFASTVDVQGRVNLSPFSFFNCFGAKPPILVFSPSRRVRDNTTKHTLENALETKEVVINIVNYAMVEQMSLASTEFDRGVNEFTKSGFTEVKSTMVTPPRVLESPIAFECKVNDVIALGEEGGAGNLIICEVLLAHFKEDVLDENNMVSPYKLDAVARMGNNWYCRANGESVFELPKPASKNAIGFDGLPTSVLKSEILTGNHLTRLASLENIPQIDDEEHEVIQLQIQDMLKFAKETDSSFQNILHKKALEFILNNNISYAWKLLLTVEYLKNKTI